MSKGKRVLRYRDASEMPDGMRKLVAAATAGPGAAARPYTPAAPAARAAAGTAGAGLVARGRPRHVADEMNKTEAAYAAVLDQRMAAGEILWWVFESVKLRLAKATFLTVDFFLMTAAGELEAHEAKGHWEEDARVKMKVAAAMYPFRFVAVQRDGAGWKVEVFA
ncbi:hypothetical protein ABWU93_11530 [Xanthomonas translucens pv. translucens]|uniref:hypothetical protein n=1 Tax=Xanthomonas campestris pv. translucens TaxID=343 RepID=UPI003F6FA638